MSKRGAGPAALHLPHAGSGSSLSPAAISSRLACQRSRVLVRIRPLSPPYGAWRRATFIIERRYEGDLAVASDIYPPGSAGRGTALELKAWCRHSSEVFESAMTPGDLGTPVLGSTMIRTNTTVCRPDQVLVFHTWRTGVNPSAPLAAPCFGKPFEGQRASQRRPPAWRI